MKYWNLTLLFIFFSIGDLQAGHSFPVISCKRGLRLLPFLSPPVPKIFEPFVGLRIFDADWSHAFVASFQEKNAAEARAILGNHYDRVFNALKKHLAETAPKNIKIEWGFFQQQDAPTNEIQIGGTFRNQQSDPIGFWFFTLNMEAKEVREGFVKVDRLYRETIRLPLTWYEGYKLFLEAVGIERERISADWTGRLIWARRGFSLDPDCQFTVDGKKVSQSECIAGNFRRFLEDEGHRFEDLVVEKNGVAVPLLEEDLNSIENYGYIRDRLGKTIRMAPNYDFRRFDLERINLPVGVAFSLGYYGAGYKEPAIVLNAEGYQTTSYYMPGWRGIRTILKK